jgi:AraC-like DNA-binding protein
MIRRIVFSSDALPAALDDRARLALLHDTLAPVQSFDVSYLADQPFVARTELVNCDGVGLLRSHTSISRLTRTARHIAASHDDTFSITFNGGASPWLLSQRGREAALSHGAAVFSDHTEPCEYRAKAAATWIGVGVPRHVLRQLVANAEDLTGASLAQPSAALKYLRRYLDFVLGPNGIEEDPALNAHIGRTLVDLVALALGAERDAAEIARHRGLRAARAQEILAEIRANFASPGCSAKLVAYKLGLSPRYINQLLHEMGSSFEHRVLELRLQKARRMLADPRCDGLKIGDIAEACGFNEVSYFNRCFRRRFGGSPTQYRGVEALR